MVTTLREAAEMPMSHPHGLVHAVGAGHPWTPAAHTPVVVEVWD